MQRAKSIFSNSGKELQKALTQELLSSKNLQKIIVIEDVLLKPMLLQSIKGNTKENIAFGCKIVSLSQAIDMALRFSNRSSHLNHVSKDLLALHLESFLQRECSSTSSEVVEQLKLQSFLDLEGELKDKRIQAYAKKLAGVFSEYGLHGKKDFEFRKGTWQRKVWSELVSTWSFPKQLNKEVHFEYLDHVEWHLFNLTHVPQVYDDLFFDKISKASKVINYFCTPSYLFWGDHIQRFEKQSIAKFKHNKSGAEQKRYIELEEYLSEQNSLLSDFAALMKRRFNALIDRSNEIQERYVSPITGKSFEVGDEHDNEACLLKTLQQGVFSLRSSSEPAQKVSAGSSLSVHVCTCKYREVEILKQNILAALNEKKDVAPCDIAIYARDIQEYLPAIEHVFGGDGRLDYYVDSLSLEKKNTLFGAFSVLFSLFESRWELNDFFDLFNADSFFKGLTSLNREDVSKIKSAFEQSQLLWGVDKEHRSALMGKKNKNSFSDKRTWKASFAELFLSMCDAQEPMIGITDYVKFGECCQIFSKVFDAYQKTKRKRSLSEWSDFLLELVDELFPSEKSSSSYLFFVEQMKRLRFLGERVSTSFRFSSIKSYLKVVFSKRSCDVASSSSKNTLHFSSMKLGGVSSKKVICMLGASEDIDAGGDVDRFKVADNQTCERFPRDDEIQRHFFLQLLLQAEKQVIFSYVNIDESDGKPKSESTLLKEVMKYIDATMQIEGGTPSSKVYYYHPHHGFDRRYFEEGSEFKSFSIKDYHLCLKAENKGLSNKHFLSSFAETATEIVEKTTQESEVYIEDLALLFRNPIKFYLTKSLGVHISERRVEKNEEFIHSFFHEREIVLSSIEEEQKDLLLPLGFFEKLSKEKIEKSVLKANESLKNLNLEPSPLSKVHFSVNVQEEIEHGSQKILPAIPIEYEGRVVNIVGDISSLFCDGLLYFGKREKKNIISLWPVLLLLSKYRSDFSGGVAHLYCLDGAKKVRLPSDEVDKCFSDILNYYYKALNSPSLLFPEFVDTLLSEKSDQLKLHSLLSKLSQGFIDSHTKWLLDYYPSFDFQKVYEPWKSSLNTVFTPCLKWAKEEVL